MQRSLLFALLATLLLVGGARAETDPDYSSQRHSAVSSTR